MKTQGSTNNQASNSVIIMKMFDKIVSHSFIKHNAVSILANELSHENARLYE